MEVMEKIKLLLIDDDEDQSIIIRDLLSNVQTQSYELEFRADHDSAMDALAYGSFDICLLDYQLGWGTGLDLLEEIAKAGRNLPVILLTEIGSHRLDLEAMRAGAVDFLPKADLTSEILERSIRYSVQAAKAKEALQRSHDELEARVRERTQELLIANETLRQKEEEIRSLVENAPDVISLFDRNLRRIYVNSKIFDNTGMDASFMIGKSFAEAGYPDSFAQPLNAALQDVFATGKEKTVELDHEAPKGRIWLQIRCAPIHNTDGLIELVMTIGRDITERKIAEQALSESRDDLKRAQAVAGIGSWRLDVRRNELRWSDETYRIFGIPPGVALTYEVFLSSVHPQDRDYVDKKWKATLRGSPYDIEYRILVGNHVKWVQEKAELRVDSHGVLLSGIGTVQDVTERKKTEEILRESEERFHAVVENMSEGLMIFDPQANLIYQNPASKRILDYDPQDQRQIRRKDLPLLFKAWDETGRLLDFDEWVVPRILRHEHVQDLVLRVLRVDTGHEWVGSYSGCAVYNAAGEISLVFLTFRDITGRKRAEDELAAAHRQLQDIIDNSTALIYAFDFEGRFLLANTAVAELLNSTLEGIIGKRRHEFMPQEDADWHEANDRQVIAKGAPLEFEEYNQLKGRSITWLTTKFPLRDAQGKIYAVAGVSADISERKSAEDALKVSEERLHLALRAAKAGSWEWDLKTNGDFWSEEVWKLFGLEPYSCEPSYEAWRAAIHPDDLENAERSVREASQNGTELWAEWRVHNPGGKERWLMSRGEPLFDAQGKPERYIGVVIDISDRKRSEIQIYKSHQEKVALLKEVHHRVKNNLQIVVSLLRLQEDSTNNPDTLAMLRDTSNRVRSMALLHEMIYRSKSLAHISFSDYIEDLCKKIHISFGQSAQGVEIEVCVEDIGIPMDKAVPCGLLINELVSNALKHAFPGVGPWSTSRKAGLRDRIPTADQESRYSPDQCQAESPLHHRKF